MYCRIYKPWLVIFWLILYLANTVILWEFYVRPYLAILIDAVREAWASRVLWVLFGISTLLLIALSGFDLQEQAAARIQDHELWKPHELAKQLVQSANDATLTTKRRIWELIPSEQQQQLKLLLQKQSEPDQFLRPLTAGLNQLLNTEQLIGNSDWPLQGLDGEAQELLNQPVATLSRSDLARRNRLLLEVALNPSLSLSRDRELVVTYFGLDIPSGSMPLLRKDYLIRVAIGTISSFFLGYLGLFAGLIVTSSVIPTTFEPGAVDLLFSKPVNRMGVYLCKFLGGCVFVLLNTSFLLGGLWLLVGWRQDVWITSLLWCIPVFTFWFMVFYSVSALVGLIWRNSIVAVTVAIGLWGLCALLNFVKVQVLDGFILDPLRLARITATNDEIIAAADAGQIYRWNKTNSSWLEILAPDDPKRVRIPGNTSINAAPLLVGPPPQVMLVQRSGRRWSNWLGQSLPLVYGFQKDQYRRQESAIAPTGTVLLTQDRQQRILAVGLNGISVLQGDLNQVLEQKPQVFGFELPLLDKKAADFQLISPQQRWLHPVTAAIDKQTDQIAVVQRQELQIFSPSKNGRYELSKKHELPGREQGLVAWCGEFLMLGFEDGTVQLLRSSDLTLVSAASINLGVSPRFIAASPSGQQLVILTHSRKLWHFDATLQIWSQPSVTGQGDLSAVAWEDDQTLWTAYHGQRLVAYAPHNNWSILKELTPEESTLSLINRYILGPLQLSLPKTGETWNLVNSLLTDEQTVITANRGLALSGPRTPVDLWTPVLSHAIWTVVLLGIGCIYIQRRDF
jgi:ABC-type transport system involved in multi-copper enzyme maturation permease subunit